MREVIIGLVAAVVTGALTVTVFGPQQAQQVGEVQLHPAVRKRLPMMRPSLENAPFHGDRVRLDSGVPR